MRNGGILGQMMLCLSLVALSAVILIFGSEDTGIASDERSGISGYVQIARQYAVRSDLQTAAREFAGCSESDVGSESAAVSVGEIKVLPPIVADRKAYES